MMRSLRRLGAATGALAAVLFAAGSALAQNTYQAPSGVFVIDLPSSYDLLVVTRGAAYQFRGDGGRILVMVLEPKADVAAAFERGIRDIRGGGLDHVALEGPAQDLKVNGHPARWGVLKGTVKMGTTTGDNVRVTLHACLGSIALQHGGVYFLTFLNDSNRAQWQGLMQQAFYSLRDAGEAVSGASEIHAMAP
jgi:hypothetical protein